MLTSQHLCFLLMQSFFSQDFSNYRPVTKDVESVRSLHLWQLCKSPEGWLYTKFGVYEPRPFARSKPDPYWMSLSKREKHRKHYNHFSPKRAQVISFDVFQFKIMINVQGRESPCGVMLKVLDCDLEESQFELYSNFYISDLYLRKMHEPLIPSVID